MFFVQSAIKKLRVCIEESAKDTETFGVILPFIAAILQEKSINYKFDISSRTIAMNILATHTGLNIRSGSVRKLATKVLVDVLKIYADLYKAATNALIASGSLLKPIDLDPLLDGLIWREANVRLTCLKTLQQYPPLSTNPIQLSEELYKPEHPGLGYSLFAATLDPDRQNADIANQLWKQYNQELGKDFQDYYFPWLLSSSRFTKETGAVAIGAALEKYPNQVSEYLSRLQELYNSNVKILFVLC